MIWFPPDDPPPFDLRVIGRRGSQTFPCVRILHRERRCPVWGRVRKNRVQWLREPPEAWRPIDPGYVHQAPKSPPASFLQRMAALDAAPQAVDQPIEGRAWWLDAGAITYSPPGSITPREAEGRVMRALVTARSTKLENPRGPGSNSDWIAKMVAKVEIETGVRERATYWHDRWTPTPRDISDCTVVIGWIAPLSAYHPSLYDVLSLRSAIPAYSWPEVGRILKVGEGGAHSLFQRALRLVTYHANEVVPRRTDAA